MKIGIITDIHENTEMLRNALKMAAANKCDELVCLGDIVGYDPRFYNYYHGRSAKTCVNLIRSTCRWIVPGNHDLYAARRVPAYSNGFVYPDRWFEMSGAERKKVAQRKVWCYESDAPSDLGEDEVAFLKSLPEYIITTTPEISCLFSHYIYPDFTGSTTGYIKRNHELKGLWNFLDLHGVKYSFSGHSHTRFTGFAYPMRKNGVVTSFFKAIHSIPTDSINLGNEMLMLLLPPLTGEKGKTGFSIFDSTSMKLDIISTCIV
ncbi:MAG: metallophosphoesterase family protein [Bacteroidales bacterium]